MSWSSALFVELTSWSSDRCHLHSVQHQWFALPTRTPAGGRPGCPGRSRRSLRAPWQQQPAAKQQATQPQLYVLPARFWIFICISSAAVTARWRRLSPRLAGGHCPPGAEAACFHRLRPARRDVFWKIHNVQEVNGPSILGVVLVNISLHECQMLHWVGQPSRQRPPSNIFWCFSVNTHLHLHVARPIGAPCKWCLCFTNTSLVLLVGTYLSESSAPTKSVPIRTMVTSWFRT